MRNNKRKHKAFTLVELLLVMGLIAVLATVVLVAVNPGRQFAQARDTQRIAHLNTILNGVSQRLADHRGLFEEGCAAGPIPNVPTTIGSQAGSYNMLPCLSPDYLSSFPTDPKTGSFTSASSYDSKYRIVAEATSSRIIVSAPDTEIGSIISVSR